MSNERDWRSEIMEACAATPEAVLRHFLADFWDTEEEGLPLDEANGQKLRTVAFQVLCDSVVDGLNTIEAAIGLMQNAGPGFTSTEWEGRSSLMGMLAANDGENDSELVEWLVTAKPGDEWRDIVTVECVS
jgi:hypothetical protein